MSVLQDQKLADPEVDGCANVGVKSTRAPLFAGVGMPCVADASGSPLGPLGARKAHPREPVSTPPTEFCACLLLVPPLPVLHGVQKYPFYLERPEVKSSLVTSCCVPLHRDTPDRASRNPAFLWGPAGLTVLLAETLFLPSWMEEAPSLAGPVPRGQR